MQGHRIYVASSWRNDMQGGVVDALRSAGHLVYDFKRPAPGERGLSWGDIDEGWDRAPAAYRRHITSSPVAAHGYRRNLAALDWCDTCVLVLPCGRSAHLELGYAIGEGKRTIILLHQNGFEPELMYLMAGRLVTDLAELVDALAAQPQKAPAARQFYLDRIMAAAAEAA